MQDEMSERGRYLRTETKISDGKLRNMVIKKI